MFSKLSQWLNDRLSLSSIKKFLLEEGIPGGAKYSYTLGSASFFLLILLFFTGIWQLFTYVPTIDHAYESLSYLRIDVPFGWLIHGLHYWGSTAFAVIVGLHMIRVFIWGAYKAPRELVWISGIFLLLLTVLFMFTGPILPWDKKGYWACKVGLDMIGSLPVIGSFLQSVFWGSHTMGQIILSRMFVFHVVILPSFIGFFVLLHIALFRKYQSAGTWKREDRQIEGKFWPDQIFKDVIVALFVFALLMTLVVFKPASFSGAADPMDVAYIPKPEWTFSFFYQLLKYFPGPLEPVGIAGIPILILLFFFSLPFIDRAEERAPLKRPFIIAFGFVFVLFISVVTIIGLVEKPVASESSAAFNTSSMEGHKLTPEEQAAHGDAVFLVGDKDNGKRLFELNCMSCHGPNGKSVIPIVPSLNPISSLFFSENVSSFVDKIDLPIQHGIVSKKGIDMPAFGDLKALTQQQIADIEAYVLEINGVNRAQIQHPGIAPKTFFYIFIGTLIAFCLFTYAYVKFRK